MASPLSAPLRVGIIDDEQLARDRLRDLLSERDDAVIAGEAEDVSGATNLIRESNLDLVFLDIKMPGGSGLDVIREIGPEAMPTTVFVTAYDEYALDAFDLAAIDYLLKPFDDERFDQAFERARKRITSEKIDEVSQRMMTLLQSMDTPEESADDVQADATSEPAESESYLERIGVQKRGQVRVVPVDRITYITADGPYAEIHTGDEKHLIRERLQTLDERLDPSEFFRIHRSTIVRLDEVELIRRGGGGNYAVELRDGTRLSVSRSRIDELENRLEIGPSN
jgi:two-component system LytT family response regulator